MKIGNKNYVMYHCHSDLSILDSCTKYQDYINLAVENGQRALSISEHGKPLNWCGKWHDCKEAGIKFIHSVEIYLTESLDPDKKVRDNYHTVLMAKNMDGVRELNRLVSISSDESHFYYANRISFDEFLGISDNIITTSACLASPLNKLPPDHPRYMELAKKYDYFEIQGHSHPDQIAFNKRLLELSKQIGTPLIAGTDTHSSTPYKAECRKVRLESKKRSYGDEDTFDLTYKTYDELVEMFREQNAIPEHDFITAIDNTNALYDIVEDIELDTSIKYPILYGSREEDDKKLTEAVNKGLEYKLKNGIIPKEQEADFRNAVAEEMRVFRKLNMCGFMLSEAELVSWCKKQGIPVGTSRGSVGGSRVAYLTDITDLNPEKWGTIFSRFANENRSELGDIDTDVPDDDRPQIFNYIISRFGKNKTARVPSFGTTQGKAAIDDIGRCLAMRWAKDNPDKPEKDNPWSLPRIAKIKSEFAKNEEVAKAEYPELFYYYDGLFDTIISQSIHPAGIVISPITLDDNYGVFQRDGIQCFMLDMDNIHDYTGLVKYDFLALKTLKVISDTCKYVGIPYPKSHEINFEDKAVWDSMLESNVGLFQMESAFAFDGMRKFKPKNIEELSLLTACIRPSGESYRNDIFARRTHKNVSTEIDELLKPTYGRLVYQEQTIEFLQKICGMSGGDADSVRRAIGRKDVDRLNASLPDILNGYCEHSDKPRDVAEREAKEFLQVIEDSASYQFGKNHSVGYCIMTYYCAYMRHYYPLEFITAYLNNAANDEDVRNGTRYANSVRIKVTMPKWGVSKSEYFFDREQNLISKGLSSIKNISNSVANELYSTAQKGNYTRFTDVLYALMDTSINSKQLGILIKIDFFSDFGNQRELLRITELFYNLFDKGNVKKISKKKIGDSGPIANVIKKYSVDVTKAGTISSFYTMLNVRAAMEECEDLIKSVNMPDLSVRDKVLNFASAAGYPGYVTGKNEDRRLLYVMDVYPLARKRDGVVFGRSIKTKSIGSGIESSFTILSRVYDRCPVHKDDIIWCDAYQREGKYFRMTQYKKM